jgi:hypothetical protein
MSCLAVHLVNSVPGNYHLTESLYRHTGLIERLKTYKKPEKVEYENLSSNFQNRKTKKKIQ